MKYDAKSELEKEFASQVLRFRLPEPKREFLFATDVDRKWRLDFYWDAYKLGVELHGLIVIINTEGHGIVRGGHATPKGMRNDVDKRNAAIILRIDVLTFFQGHVANNDAINMTMRALAVKGWKGPGS